MMTSFHSYLCGFLYSIIIVKVPRNRKEMNRDRSVTLRNIARLPSLQHFLCSNADGLITDNVLQAAEVQKSLEKRTDLQRMIDRIMAIVS